jgi:hypothetical protein
MRRIPARLLAVLLLAATCPVASAIPSLSFCYPTDANGYRGLSVTNDTGNVLPFILIKSGHAALGEFPRGNLLSGDFLSIPGTFVDLSDQPAIVSYSNFPVGTHFLGNGIAPTSADLYYDLSLDYYVSPTTPPRLGVVTICPEPATASLAGVAFVAAAVRRRANRQPRAGDRLAPSPVSTVSKPSADRHVQPDN